MEIYLIIKRDGYTSELTAGYANELMREGMNPEREAQLLELFEEKDRQAASTNRLQTLREPKLEGFKELSGYEMVYFVGNRGMLKGSFLLVCDTAPADSKLTQQLKCLAPNILSRGRSANVILEAPQAYMERFSYKALEPLSTPPSTKLSEYGGKLFSDKTELDTQTKETFSCGLIFNKWLCLGN